MPQKEHFIPEKFQN